MPSPEAGRWLTSEEPQAPVPQRATVVERVTQVGTGIGRLAGIALGVAEGFGQARPLVLLVAAILYMGAQQAEDFAMNILGRTLK